MSSFSLDLPTEEEVKEEVKTAILPTEKEEVMIADTAEERAKQIMDVDLDSFEQRKEYTDVINAFGVEDMKAARNKNAILQKRVGYFEKIGGELTKEDVVWTFGIPLRDGVDEEMKRKNKQQHDSKCPDQSQAEGHLFLLCFRFSHLLKKFLKNSARFLFLPV